MPSGEQAIRSCSSLNIIGTSFAVKPSSQEAEGEKVKRKYPNLTLGAKLFMVAIFACLFASAWIFIEAIYG